MFRRFQIMHQRNQIILNDQNVLTRFELLGSDDYLFHESSAIPTGAMYMAYNAQVIDKLGLEAPEKLAEKGEWTWDKFEEYAKKCTQDTDGDGKVDMYGYGNSLDINSSGDSVHQTTQKSHQLQKKA